MRYTRQELKQDKFAESAADAVHWTVAHRRTIVIGGIAVLAILAVLIAGFWYHSYRNAVASEQLGNALVVYNAPIRPAGTPETAGVLSFGSIAERAITAKKDFYRVSSEYGSTRSGQWAHYFAALAEVDLANYPVAEGQLKDVGQSRDPEIASLGRRALASVYLDEGKEADAIATFKELIEHPTATVPKSSSQLELADIYKSKQPDEARKLYEQITKDDPKSGAAQVAAQHQKAITQ